MIKKILVKRVKPYLMAIAFVLLLQFILLVGVLVYMAKGYNITPPEETGNKGTFAQILIDSINKYGVDFTSGLTIYLEERFNFEDYVEFTYTKDEVVQKVDENDGLKVIRDRYKDLYGDIVAEKGNLTYYNWYFPIAGGYQYKYANDYGNPRPNEREHLGNDLMCSESTPIIAVESGTITNLGWNELGGWRIGITSDNGKRYWYYAHMRKIHPYVKSLKKGSKIKGGQVIGYVGSTGYSDAIANESLPENSLAVDNKFEKHLHIGVYRIMGGEKVPYNPYPILKVLEKNTINTKKQNDEQVSIAKSVKDRSIKLFFTIDSNSDIGFLSAEYESNGNPGTVANVEGDYLGGKSYGAFQFASRQGSVLNFLYWLRNVDRELHNRLWTAMEKDGGFGSTFDDEWRQIGRSHPQYFYDIQYRYIKESYYNPTVRYFQQKGFNIESRSRTLKAVVWSTAVQHGSGGAIQIIKMQNLKGSDKEIITGIYRERMKVNIYFGGSSPSVRNAVYNRFINELDDALVSLKAEGEG